ncbi:MAG TPA: hypothetical protein VN635_04820 [Conexibacter sp.]|nr:hypothetical protein [Conexibacter sp.]
MHRKVAAALLAVLALGAASCGSSETTVTRAQLVSRIESACRVAQRTAQQQIARASASARRSGATLVIALSNYQRYVLGRVEHVKVSNAAAQSDLAAIKDAGRERLAMVERARKAGGDTQRALLAMQSQSEAVTRRLQTALRGLGITGCA